MNAPTTATTLTKDQLVARVQALHATVIPARGAAMDKMPVGMAGLAIALDMYDCGIFNAEKTLANMRRILDVPVIPGSVELGELEVALYRGHYLGREAELEAGVQGYA